MRFKKIIIIKTSNKSFRFRTTDYQMSARFLKTSKLSQSYESEIKFSVVCLLQSAPIFFSQCLLIMFDILTVYFSTKCQELNGLEMLLTSLILM